MNNKKVSLFFLYSTMFFFILKSYTFAEGETCAYTSEIEQCREAQSAQDTGPRSIEEFTCLQTQNQADMVYQIVLDKKFQVLDKDMRDFIKWLETNKNYFFGSEAQKTPFDAVELMNCKFGIEKTGDDCSKFYTNGGASGGRDAPFWERYSALCNGVEEDSILQQSMVCLGGATPLSQGGEFIQLQGICENIIKYKLLKYNTVAGDILKLNKMQIRKDQRKEFFQKRRNGYQGVMDLFTTNIAYLERIWKKWNVKIKDTY